MTIAISKRFDELKATGLLPSPTGVAMEILRLTQNEGSTIKQIAQTIQADPALTGRTLKFANSAHAGARKPIASVSEAVVRLGMRTVGTLSLGFSVLSSSRRGPCEGFDYDRFWSNSLVLGIASKTLCGMTKAAPQEEGFACGLLSQIGRLALASVYPEKYAEVLTTWANGSGKELRDLEQQAFSTDHAEMTAAMMEDWRLPESFQIAVLNQIDDHRKAPSTTTPSDVLTLILQTANQIARICVEDEHSHAEPIKKLMACYDQIDLESSGLADLCDEVAEQWQTWGEILNVNTRELPKFEEILEKSREAEAEATVDANVETEGESNPHPKSLRILVAEDDPLQLALITKLVKAAGHSVVGTPNGREALRTALETNPDVVITDWMMPEMDGFELCRSLRKAKFGRQLYLIIMTSNGEEERLVEAFEAGADDYLVKPLRARPLQARIRAAVRMIELQHEVELEREHIRQMTAELAVVNRKLEQAAFTDALTALPNRRYLIKRLKEEWSIISRKGGQLSCMLLDIDRFKSVNDTYGHDVGDLVLKKVAAVLQTVTRDSDVVCRQGGEEFVVVCPGSDLQSAAQGAERLRSKIESETLGYFEQFEHPITVSVGVATRESLMRDEDVILKAADEALYRAKETGRNRVCCANDKPVEKISKIQDSLRSLFQ
ncbi:HDOD domain-containing protein [Symmachiella dynata]|uniref:HDOD domain-containing protein n=1 Tax=Symmachiella dynata TaxID=2527995 RepID=UPI0021BC7F1D|nr:HDOD domain-containing protein [Symmachiella dynata]